jgi:hypothetical protein
MPPKSTRPATKARAKKAPKRSAKKASNAGEPGPVGQRIADLGDWRAATLGRMRKLIRAADPHVVEELKWRKPSNPGGVPVWSHHGIICTGESYKTRVKMTFAKGSKLNDPKKLFNANLVGARRAIDLHEGESVDESAFKALIRQAVALNQPKRMPG